jgi:uncharacterized membrane protein YoaK (UPF0700 family)
MSESSRPGPASPPDGPRRPLVVSLAALTLVSGFLDAVSFLGLGHVFVANMTGNVVLLGFALAGAAGFSTGAALCALGGFLVGGVVGGRIAHRMPPHRSVMIATTTAESALTVAATVIAAWVPAVGSGWPRYTVVTLLALGVGARNAAVRRLRVPDMTTTVLTTTLTDLSSQSPLAGGTNRNARLGLTSVVSMFAGAIVGAALTLHVHPAAALGVASVVMVATTGFFLREAPARLGLT